MRAISFARRVIRQAGTDEVADRAAGLSFHFILALFPAAIFLTALLGWLSRPELMDELMAYAGRVLPGDAASLLSRTLDEVVSGARGGVVWAGLAGAFWAASNGISSIIRALNKAYDVAEPRPWWRRRLTALSLTLGFSILTPAATFLIGFGDLAGERFARWAGLGDVFILGWDYFRWAAGLACAFAGVGLIYRLAPPHRRTRPVASIGAAFAVAAWLAASFGMRVYLERSSRYNEVYGSLAGVIVLLVWLYVSAYSLLMGAEIDAELERGQKHSSVAS